MVAYSPHDLLPTPRPETTEYDEAYFYEQVVKHCIKDTVRIMNNGLHIDLDKVIKLEERLDSELESIRQGLAKNEYVKLYIEATRKKDLVKYRADRKSKIRSADYYKEEFKPSNMQHRSLFMYFYAKDKNFTPPKTMLFGDIPKWTAKDVKPYAETSVVLKQLLNKTIDPTNSYVVRALDFLAETKANLYNEKYLEQIKNPEIPYPEFNPNSATQKSGLMGMLGIQSQTKTGSGADSWGRQEFERVLDETDDEVLKDFATLVIDSSFASIISSTFIPAFYKFTVNNRLHGTYNLLGAKTGRFTSNAP